MTGAQRFHKASVTGMMPDLPQSSLFKHSTLHHQNHAKPDRP